MTQAAVLAARARQLTRSEWWLLGESVVAAVVVEVGLRVTSLARIVHAIERRSVHTPVPASRQAAERMVRLAAWPYRVLPLPSTCLRVSLVRLAVLRRRGVPAALRLGVRKTDSLLEAHAWVEYQGPLGEEPHLDLYQPLDPIPPAEVIRSARWST